MGAKKRSRKTWKFVLYVIGRTAKSGSAISNLEQICKLYLGNDYAIEIIDLLEHPELARQHQILAVPTAIRTYPLPERRAIGDLSRPEMVVAFLELPTQWAQTTSPPEHPVSPEKPSDSRLELHTRSPDSGTEGVKTPWTSRPWPVRNKKHQLKVLD